MRMCAKSSAEIDHPTKLKNNMSKEKPHSMLDVQKNVMTKTLCLNSTKSDWDTATQNDKEYLVEYCTGRLNMRIGNSFDTEEVRKLVDDLFDKDAVEDTTFVTIFTDAYQSFRDESPL